MCCLKKIIFISSILNIFKLLVSYQVIIGVSAAFLVWDAIDLGFTISDLVN